MPTAPPDVFAGLNAFSGVLAATALSYAVVVAARTERGGARVFWVSICGFLALDTGWFGLNYLYFMLNPEHGANFGMLLRPAVAPLLLALGVFVTALINLGEAERRRQERTASRIEDELRALNEEFGGDDEGDEEPDEQP